MAGQAAKKAKANASSVDATWNPILLAVNAIYLAYRAGLHWSSFSSYHIFGYLVLLVVSVVCKSMLVEAAASSTGSEYYNDILLITLFVQVGTMFSDYFWYTYLVIPAYGIYQVVSRWVAFMLDGKEGGVPVDEADMDPATLKKMKKMQRKQARGR